jgi:hypothetical protein
MSAPPDAAGMRNSLSTVVINISAARARHIQWHTFLDFPQLLGQSDPGQSQRSRMDPHDASLLVAKLCSYFDGIAAPERELLERLLERFSVATTETVIARYAEETTTFDRGRLRTLLFEEHSRRTRQASPTAEWRTSKEADLRTRDAVLDGMTQSQLRELVEAVRCKHSAVFRMLHVDPLETDIGRSLIYQEWKDRQKGQFSGRR